MYWTPGRARDEIFPDEIARDDSPPDVVPIEVAAPGEAGHDGDMGAGADPIGADQILEGAAPAEHGLDADELGDGGHLDSDEPDDIEPDGDDYYAVLGVAPSASAAAVRQAFRRQAMRWHPDHFTTASLERQEYAARRMRAILAAQHTLGDPLRRHLYDRARAGTRSSFAWLGVGGRTHDDGSGVTYARAAVPHGVGGHAGGNDNPAGILFGVLSAIVALALAGRALTTLDAGPGTVLSLALIVLFAALAALFFSRDSVLSRVANAYMEREPRNDDAVPAAPFAAHPFAAHTASWDDEPQLSDFEVLVDEALAGVPEEFQRYLDNVVVRVKDEPSDDELRRMKLRPCTLLLGLYEGVPLIHRGIYGGGPEVVTIFRGPIEAYCGGDDERIRRQVRATVLHELAHHFGMDHDEMPAWIK